MALARLAGAQVEPGGAAGVAGVTVLEETQWQGGGTRLSVPAVAVRGPEGLTWHEAPRYPGGQAQSSTSSAGGRPVACGTATSRVTSASLRGQRGSALPCHPAVSPPDPTRNPPALLWLLRVGRADHEQVHVGQGHQEVLAGGITPVCAAPGALCHTGVMWGPPSPTAPSPAPGAPRVTSPAPSLTPGVPRPTPPQHPV